VPSITPSAGQSIHSSRVMFAWPPYEHYLYAELTEGRRLGVLWRSSRLLAFAISDCWRLTRFLLPFNETYFSNCSVLRLRLRWPSKSPVHQFLDSLIPELRITAQSAMYGPALLSQAKNAGDRLVCDMYTSFLELITPGQCQLSSILFDGRCGCPCRGRAPE
jgi:hypothetical protein